MNRILGGFITIYWMGMKKILLTLIAVFAISIYANAQNLQLHYDFGEDREYYTTTFEMFKVDKYGSTFTFTDLDYAANGSVSGAYMEIARGIKFWDEPLEVHIEFNGGTSGIINFNNAWLFGAHYTFASQDFSRIFTIQAMYKNIERTDYASFQLTGVWTLNFFDNMITFSGFADFWKEEVYVADEDGNPGMEDYVFLTEPQIWYNPTKQFSVGTEIELSNNFAAHKGFMVNPTLAVRWTF